MADLTLGLLLATVREIPQAERFVRAGKWKAGAFPLGTSLRTRRVALWHGTNRQAIARRLEAFGVPIAYHSRKPAAVSITPIIRTSSHSRALSIH